MSDRDLNRAVARATGEFVETIQRLGFRLDEDDLPDECDPLVIDWDDQSPAYLSDVVLDDRWPPAGEPLPSWDEDFDTELEEALAHAA